MSTPDPPNYPGETPRYPAGQQPGEPRDPYAPGPPSGPSGYPGGQPGYPSPGQGGNPPRNPAGIPPGNPPEPPSYPGQGGPGQTPYPGQAPYPGPSQYPTQNPYVTQNPYQAQNPYQGQGGYPGQQLGGYPPAQGGYPGYPGGPAAYQGYPGYPGYAAGPVAEPVRPVTVTVAFWCWIAVIAGWAVSLIILLTSSAWDQALAAATNATNRSSTSTVVVDAQSVINFVRVFAVVVFVIVAGLYLLFAFKMLAGRNWARITLTVLGVLGVLGSITPSSHSVTVNGEVYASSPVPALVTAVLTLAAVALMFVDGANEFFTASKAYRSQSR